MLAARLRAGELTREAVTLLALLGDADAQGTLGLAPAPHDLDAWAQALDACGPEVGLRAHVAVGRALLDACGSGRARVERVLDYALGWAAAAELPADRRAESRWVSARAMQEEALRGPPPTRVARWVLRAPEAIERGWSSLLQGAPDAVRSLARATVESELRRWACV